MPINSPPPVLCQFWRGDGRPPFVAFPYDLAPEFNIDGLFWRLTGVGRAQLEAMPERERERVTPKPVCEEGRRWTQGQAIAHNLGWLVASGLSELLHPYDPFGPF